MSAITSPRASTTSLQTSTSSRRTSIDTVTGSQANSPSRVPQPQQRRNRAALRDYYGLKSSAAPADTNIGLQHAEGVEAKDSELDREGFDAENYVREVLGREGLEGILRVEGGLINGAFLRYASVMEELGMWKSKMPAANVGHLGDAEIKGLDGERKALVYDNYSKLITATDTIRKMRTKMDPLIPTTSMLVPAISHIAETAAALAISLQDRTGQSQSGRSDRQAKSDKAKQQGTVRWVLRTPIRIRALLGEGQKEQASKEWEEVSRLLDKWKGVAGVDEVRAECTKVLHEGDEGRDGLPQAEEIAANGA